ncbi:MAG: cell division protein FtsZ, partial [Aeromicrobium sp.]
AATAAELAVSSPLLEASIEGARGVLLSIAGGSDLGLFEINEAAELVQQAVHDDAKIIFGTVIDDSLGDEVRITVIAAGFDGGEPKQRDAAQPALRSRDQQAAAAKESATPTQKPAERSNSSEQRVVTEPVPVGQPAGQEFGDGLDIPDFLR